MFIVNRNAFLQVIGFLCILCTFLSSQAQIIDVSPPYPNADDSVTVTFFADRGNQALKDYTGRVYLHTGIISGSPENPSEWKHIRGEWGKADPTVAMKRVRNNMYQITFHIRSFYQIKLNEPFLQMGFVFRNEDGSRVGTPKNAEEIYYPDLSEWLDAGNVYAQGVSRSRQNHVVQVGDYEAYTILDDQLILYTNQAALGVQVYNPGWVQVSFFPDGHPSKHISEVISTDSLHKVPLNIIEGTEEMNVSWGNNYILNIRYSPLRLTIYKEGKVIFSETGGCYVDPKAHYTGLKFQLVEDEYIYGGGARAIPMNRRGYQFSSFNEAMEMYEEGEIATHFSIPFFISSQGYGLYVDGWEKGWFNIGHVQADMAEIGFKRQKGLSYVLFLSDTLAQISREFYRFTGRQEIPPLWALGYIQSGNSFQSQQEVMNGVNIMTRREIPLSALSLNHSWYGGPTSMGKWDWNLKRFPDPAGMIASLQRKGIQLILNTEPYIHHRTVQFDALSKNNLLAQNNGGSAYVIPDFWAGPSGLLDLFNKNTQQWLWNKYRPLVEMGISGWASNLGEPANHPINIFHADKQGEIVHNLYGKKWAELLSSEYQLHYPEQRLFNLVRSGYTGIQRYQAYPWTGNVACNWSGLRTQPSMILSMGLQGLGYAHSVIGGFKGTTSDPELFRRWFQFGTFSPIMRTFSEQTSTLPYSYDSYTHEIIKKAISLRYQLLPYNYSMSYENHRNGSPLAKPLWYTYPNDSMVYDSDDSYLWGNDFLIIPITSPNLSEITTYLPGETWIDWYDGTIYNGGKNVTLALQDDHLPVLVRAESIIPVIPNVSQQGYPINGKTYGDTLLLRYFSSPSEMESDASMNIYFDDGVYSARSSGKTQATWKVNIQRTAKKLALSIEEHGDSSLTPSNMIFEWRTFHQCPNTGKYGKTKLSLASSKREVVQASESMYWDIDTEILYIHVQRKEPTDILKLKY